MLAIIILNYNSYEKTIECVKSIQNTYNGEYIIYLLDNASSNESVQVLKQHYFGRSNIKLIFSEKNLGYAKGNNICLRMAEQDGCDYAIVANNDIIFTENSILKMVDYAKMNNYLAVGPKIEKVDGSTQVSIKNNRPTFIEYIFRETYLRNFIPYKMRKPSVPQNPKEVYWLVGCLFCFDLEKFKKIDYFDENTFLFFEEYILSEKALRNGMKLAFFPDAKVIHYHGASMGGNLNMLTRHANWESEIYFLSNYLKWNRLRKKIIMILRDIEVKHILKKQKNKKELFRVYKGIG